MHLVHFPCSEGYCCLEKSASIPVIYKTLKRMVTTGNDREAWTSLDFAVERFTK